MGSIVLLDELTINQIAAGEVIERPANVVKELIENSIDAGATKINVEIENGGISLIRISDNGKGIAPDDVEIAFERHATSKIRSSKDLMKVSTMGFRGEALASIASIAKVELVTKTANETTGTKIVLEGGDVVLKEECGAPQGTTITVRELFYNTPVRYKFLKKDYTEASYIETAMERIALMHPHISFRLLSNKKPLLQTNGNGDLQTAVFHIFGKDISQNVVNVDFEYEGIKVEGVVGKPEIARSNRANQMFYVNSRYIKDKTLAAATEEAYRTLIPQGKFGFCVLNVKLNPELVDVNVHPAKLEVRFTDENNVFKAVYHGVRNALLGNDLVVEESADHKPLERNNTVKAPEKKGLFEIYKGPNHATVTENHHGVIEANFGNHWEEGKKEEEPKEIPQEEIKKENAAMIQEEVATYHAQKEMENHVMPNYEQDMIEKVELPEYKILGVAFNTYIILQLEDDIYILDQHAAHERVLYEKVKKNFYDAGGNETQMLLLPDVLNLSKKDMRAVRHHKKLFEQSGFDIEEFGEDAIKINGVPVICYDMNTKDLFMDILDGIDITNRTNKQDIEEKFIATVACKAAVKGNMHLDESEICSLLDELLQLESPFTCPHGRPTAIRISRGEIERKFGRK